MFHFAWPWQDRNRRFSWLKAVTFALMFAPAIWLLYHVEAGTFGAVPLAGMTYWSGVWATAFLLLALVVTPARTLLRWNQLIVVRRMIGVTGLVYTIAHIIIYFALRFWDFASIVNEMVTRISLIIATVSTIGLIALGATSFDEAIRRMGIKNWDRLHDTVYVLTGLAVFHYLLSPGLYSSQYLMTGVFAWLMAWRVLDRKGRGRDPRTLVALAVASSLFTAFFEAGWTWVYQDIEPSWALGNNFNLVFGISPAWKVLIGGLLAALAAGTIRIPQRTPAG